MSKRPDENCEECDDRDMCDVLETCRIARDGDKRLSDLTPQEVLDTVCPSGPIAPRKREDEAA